MFHVTHLSRRSQFPCVTLSLRFVFFAFFCFRFILVHHQRLELWTPWLRVRCSTNWAIPLYVIIWWAFRDLNPGPTGYEPVALTNWAKGPYSKNAATQVTAISLAPPVGFEPTTLRLTAGCSTVELRRHKQGIRLSESLVLALTYLPGPSPDKYCRHWWA